MKINERAIKWSLAENTTLHCKEHCTKIDAISLIVMGFFFSQTNLVFKSNLHLLPYWIVFAKVYLYFYLLIIDTLRIFKFIQCFYSFLYKNQ